MAIRNTYLFLSIVLLVSVGKFYGQARSDELCLKPSASSLLTIAQYIQAKFKLGNTPNVNVDQVAGDCYVSLTFTGVRADGQQPFRTRLFLTPDGTHLASNVLNLAVAPAVAERQERQRLSSIVLEGAKLISTKYNPLVTVVIYSDFQCPYCALLWTNSISPMLGSTRQNARVYYRSFPLDSIHPWARAADLRANCGYQQGSQYFYGIADLLFNNQPAVTTTNVNRLIDDYLKQQPLFNQSAYQNCLSSNVSDDELKADVDSATKANVTAVPTIFVNGKRFQGVANPGQLQRLITDAEKEAAQVEQPGNTKEK